MSKKGDTLIEVTLAIGIFSMIAIAIVSVMSASTSNAQTALETTLAREEIDAQAEALRFIQSSYVSGDAEDERYSLLWKAIAKLGDKNKAEAGITQFSPDSCASLYRDNYLAGQNAFILNINKLATFDAKHLDDVLVEVSKSPTKFQEASISYPRIFYTNSADDSLISDSYDAALERAEGIFIVPVKDQSKTVIFVDGGRSSEPAFYDFYIRTCWYGTNSDRPSTISTLIRLYNPAVTISE